MFPGDESRGCKISGVKNMSNDREQLLAGVRAVLKTRGMCVLYRGVYGVKTEIDGSHKVSVKDGITVNLDLLDNAISYWVRDITEGHPGALPGEGTPLPSPDAPADTTDSGDGMTGEGKPTVREVRDAVDVLLRTGHAYIDLGGANRLYNTDSGDYGVNVQGGSEVPVYRMRGGAIRYWLKRVKEHNPDVFAEESPAQVVLDEPEDTAGSSGGDDEGLPMQAVYTPTGPGIWSDHVEQVLRIKGASVCIRGIRLAHHAEDCYIVSNDDTHPTWNLGMFPRRRGLEVFHTLWHAALNGRFEAELTSQIKDFGVRNPNPLEQDTGKRMVDSVGDAGAEGRSMSGDTPVPKPVGGYLESSTPVGEFKPATINPRAEYLDIELSLKASPEDGGQKVEVTHRLLKGGVSAVTQVHGYDQVNERGEFVAKYRTGVITTFVVTQMYDRPKKVKDGK